MYIHYVNVVIIVLQVISRAESLVARVQQHIRSEQDTNPIVSDSIQAEFKDKGELLQLTSQLGELKFRECKWDSPSSGIKCSTACKVCILNVGLTQASTRCF